MQSASPCGGDSQAEGVCVADDDKLFAQIEFASQQDLVVFPFARSGQDASDWLPQMPEVERNLDVDAHLILIVDLPDLDPTIKSDHHGPPKSNTNSRIAANVPAFVIQGGRHLLTDNEGYRRRLRFMIGPNPSWVCVYSYWDELDDSVQQIPDWESTWAPKLQQVREATSLPIVIAYAPMSPSITDGVVCWSDPHAEQFRQISMVAARIGIEIVDTSFSLKASAQAGQWPHGFHNGQIGSGHLNAIGYQVIAKELASVDWQKQDKR